jgi:hypothetical protein
MKHQQANRYILEDKTINWVSNLTETLYSIFQAIVAKSTNKTEILHAKYSGRRVGYVVDLLQGLSLGSNKRIYISTTLDVYSVSVLELWKD